MDSELFKELKEDFHSMIKQEKDKLDNAPDDRTHFLLRGKIQGLQLGLGAVEAAEFIRDPAWEHIGKGRG